MFKSRAILAGAVALGALAIQSMPARAQSGPDREVAYQGNAYTVYLEAPQYCTMYLDTDRQSMLRFSYRRSSGEIYFSFVRQGFPAIPSNRSFPIHFQFDDSSTSIVLTSVGYATPDGGTGFSSSVPQELLDRWAKHSTVKIRLGDKPLTIIETVPLRGSAQAINQFTACTLPGYSVTVMPPSPEEMGFPSSPPPPPPPSPKTALGLFSIRCNRQGGSTYYAGRTVIGRGLDCDESGTPELATANSFATGEQILLVTKPVSANSAAGSIVYIKPGATPRLINIGYMSDFASNPAPNKVVVVTSGQLDLEKPRAVWVCELTINWQTARVTSAREQGTDTGMCETPQ